MTAANAADATVKNGATASFTFDTILAQTSVGFRNQIVGSASAAQSVAIRNSGSAALAIQQVTVTEEFTQTNDCGSSLAAGAQCTVRVTSNPASIGERRGIVSVIDDLVASPRSIVLSVTGTDFAVTAAGTSAATIRAGQSATFVLNLETRGGALSDDVTFGCSGLPQGFTCSFNPATISAGTVTATRTLTIATSATERADGLTPLHSRH